MLLFYQPEIGNGVHHLNEEESRHAVKVLRLGTGQEIDLTNGQGQFYKARITEAHQKRCGFDISETKTVAPFPVHRHLAIAPTKNIDRLEWFVEKAVEFGVDRITPIICDHSERRIVKRERLHKKAVSAMKQSLKAWFPQIDEAMPYKSFLNQAEADQKFIAYVDNDNTDYLSKLKKASGSHLVLIGPEGDFSENEVRLAIESGFTTVSLGPSRLRTETAAIAAVHLLNL
ncbi:MAG: 16S rRNA (uracil(1498)-N(3))-methyltransferase [Roseivirga sp.]|nr:16S rRNA (uracil(1498)-N(3))-methyltransferase [Roseivirga sp.]